MNITICGGGNIAHAIAAKLSRTEDISILTRKPFLWSNVISYIQEGREQEYGGQLKNVSDDPAIVKESTLIIVTVPQFATNDIVNKIKPYLHSGQTVLFTPAPVKMKEIAESLINGVGIDIIGMQRVPYVARISEYGRSVIMSDNKPVHKIFISNNDTRVFWDDFITNRFGGRTEYLSSFWAFSFSNSNPLLHPSRLMALLDKQYYDRIPLFYAEWTDESSELYIKSDAEMLSIMKKYPVDISKDYESAFDHYGVKSISELTQKLRTIPSLHYVTAPYKLENGVYIPDLTSRYFTEDVMYGTSVMLQYAINAGVETPTISYFVSRITDLFQK